MFHLGHGRGASRRGATRRRKSRRWASGDADRWLDRLVDVAVITALLVSGTALVLSRLL